MNNLSVVDELRALVPAVQSTLPLVDHEAAAAAVNSVISIALEVTAGGVKPSQTEVDTAADQWNRAATQWADAIREVRQSQGSLGGSWAGADAELCANALTSFTTQSEQPAKGCVVAVDALRTLAGELEGPRDAVTAGRTALAALQGAAGAGSAAEAKRHLVSLIAAFEEAEGAGNRAALRVGDATDSLTFPAQLTLNLVAPFMRAVRLSQLTPAAPTPSTSPTVPSQVKPVTSSKTAKPKAAAPKTTRPKVMPTIKLRSGKPVAVSKARATVLSTMRKYQGVPYKWGGTTPRGFDCSGFVQYVFRQAGIRLPRTSAAQRRAGVVVPRSQARPGDLVCMPGHVGIYLGNGMMYDAPRTGKTIGERRIWTNNYTIVRVMKD